MSLTTHQPKVGLVLGSGSARGWAHIGVIRALAEAGVVPDAICGCSIGAFVGAVHADGDLAKLEDWVSGLAWQDVVSLLDVSLKGGFIKGAKLIQYFERNFVDRDFAQLPVPFACVATNLETGREVWLREGSVAHAVRASIALPGLFTPVAHEGGFLIDGGLVNPVPVSLCRAMGMDVVIAVDLNSDILGRHLQKAANERPEENEVSWTQRVLERFGVAPDTLALETGDSPSLVTVLATSINIMQVRIGRSRMAGDPADVLIAPRLAHLGLMDFHRGAEGIAEGRAAVERSLPGILHALGRAP
ncbi:MAG: patatin-like phospholipase RssA [Rhodocyclaceae bacterium]